MRRLVPLSGDHVGEACLAWRVDESRFHPMIPGGVITARVDFRRGCFCEAITHCIENCRHAARFGMTTYVVPGRAFDLTCMV